MSQQHTTQASSQGTLGRAFKLREHGTTARTEVIAGLTTLLTVIYIVFVNPRILGVASMDTSAVFVTACLIAVFDSIMMELFANLPVALAPAMGLNAFFAFVIVQAMGLLWQVGMGVISWSAIGLLLLTIFHARCWMIASIPVSLYVGVTSGIGLLIGMMGLKSAGMIVANPEMLVSIGNLTSYNVLPGALGFFTIAILASRNIHVAMLVSIVVATLSDWMLGNIHRDGIVSAPPSVMTVVGHADLAGLFNLGLVGVIFSFMLTSLFNSSDTLIGVTDKVRLTDEKGKSPCVKQVLCADNVSSMTGSSIGTSSVTVHIEPPSDIFVGGHTGLTAVAVGLSLLLATFLSLLVGIVPGYAAAGVLIYAGVLITSSLARVSWQDLTESVPAFITVVMTPFSFSITEGITLGFISYCVMKTGAGHLRDLNLCVIIVVLLFILKTVFIGAH